MNSKPGVDYESIRNRIRTLDALLFRGSDIVSNTIIKIEGAMDKTEVLFSHVAMAIEGRHLMPCARDSERAWLKPDGLYVYESTMSGTLSEDGVKDVEGRSHLCVQLRDMDQVVTAYDLNNPDTRIAWCPVKDELRPADDLSLCVKTRAVYDRYLGLSYDASLLDLGGAALPVIRSARDSHCFAALRDLLCGCCGGKSNKRKCVDSDVLPRDNVPSHWQFCSELCTNIYRDMGLVPLSCNPENVMPQDMVPKADGKTTYDADGQFPVLFGQVVRIHTHKKLCTV